MKAMIMNSPTVNSAQIQDCKATLLNYLIHLEDGRKTEELTRIKEIVAALAPEIQAFLDLGVGYAEISKQLKSQGVQVDSDSLRDLYINHCIQEHKIDMEEKFRSRCEMTITLSKDVQNVSAPTRVGAETPNIPAHEADSVAGHKTLSMLKRYTHLNPTNIAK